MLLGGPVPFVGDPDRWAAGHTERGYRAAYWPLPEDTAEDLERETVRAAERHGILVAEVGAWSNPISPDAAVAGAAVDRCCRQLALADRVGALCCVNIAGSRGVQWDGPHPDNLTAETFDLIVETVRKIIDAVKPRRACYSLEPMPWVFPDSPQSYRELIRAIDRPAFAAHLDPVNIISSPQLYYRNSQLIRECFQLLGPWIKSCHAKDVVLSGRLTIHLDEVRPGQGALDYATFVTEIDALNPQMPLMLEHLPGEEEYRLAADHVRSVLMALEPSAR